MNEGETAVGSERQMFCHGGAFQKCRVNSVGTTPYNAVTAPIRHTSQRHIEQQCEERWRVGGERARVIVVEMSDRLWRMAMAGEQQGGER